MLQIAIVCARRMTVNILWFLRRVLLFGTKKLRTLGGDLGAAIKGFKKAMNDDDAAAKKGADVDLQAEKLSHKE